MQLFISAFLGLLQGRYVICIGLSRRIHVKSGKKTGGWVTRTGKGFLPLIYCAL